MARDAVFRSWLNDRAKTYRRINNIDDMLGTAVNVQAMVFGNLGETSGTGVGFTRNPATGVKEFYGEFLMNAQGEDVVAGIRTPVHISELEKIHARCLQPAARDHHAAGKALSRHAGLRVHHPGRPPVHAADAQRQAHRSRRGAGRHPDGGRRADHEGRSDLPRRAQPALRLPGAQPRREGQGHRSAGDRPAGLAGRGRGPDRFHRGRSGGEVQQGQDGEADPGARRDHARGHRRAWKLPPAF